MKSYRIFHSSKGYVVKDDFNGEIIKTFKTLKKAKMYIKKRKLKGMQLARKMRKEGYDSSDIVQKTGYNL